MRFLKTTLIVALGCAACGLIFPGTASAWIVCMAPSPTLNELFTRSDTVVLARWFSGEKPVEGSTGSTLFEVVQVPRAANYALERGDRFTVHHFCRPKKGNLALIFGTRSTKTSIEWITQLEVDSTLYNYIVRAPARDADGGERLRYFLSSVDHPNKKIADDAFAELSAIPIKQLVAGAGDLPRDFLRASLRDPDLNPARLSLYALMLGLCGNREDAELMIDTIAEPSEDFRIGIEGMMAGYLFLTGEQGLEVIEELKLREQKESFAEIYAALQAVRVVWNSGDSGISHERLQAAVYPLIDRAELTDLVINDLARWKDWSMQPRLMQLYGVGAYDIPSIKRAIIRYMIASTKDVPAGTEKAVPLHAANGARHLDELRRRDPRLVAECERFFFLQ